MRVDGRNLAIKGVGSPRFLKSGYFGAALFLFISLLFPPFFSRADYGNSLYRQLSSPKDSSGLPVSGSEKKVSTTASGDYLWEPGGLAIQRASLKTDDVFGFAGGDLDTVIDGIKYFSGKPGGNPTGGKKGEYRLQSGEGTFFSDRLPNGKTIASTFFDGLNHNSYRDVKYFTDGQHNAGVAVKFSLLRVKIIYGLFSRYQLIIQDMQLTPRPKPAPKPPVLAEQLEIADVSFDSAKIPEGNDAHFIFGYGGKPIRDLRMILDKSWLAGLKMSCSVYDKVVYRDGHAEYHKNDKLACNHPKFKTWDFHLFEKGIGGSFLVINDMELIDSSKNVYRKHQLYDPLKHSNLFPSTRGETTILPFSKMMTEMGVRWLRNVDYTRPALPEFKALDDNEKYHLQFSRDFNKPCEPNPNGVGSNCGFMVNPQVKIQNNPYNGQHNIESAVKKGGVVRPGDMKTEYIYPTGDRYMAPEVGVGDVIGPIQIFSDEGYSTDYMVGNHSSTVGVNRATEGERINSLVVYDNMPDNNRKILNQLIFIPDISQKMIAGFTGVAARSYNKNGDNDLIEGIGYDLTFSPTSHLDKIKLNFATTTNNLFVGATKHDSITGDGRKFVVNTRALDRNKVPSGMYNASQVAVSDNVHYYLLQELFGENADRPTRNPGNFKVSRLEASFSVNSDGTLNLDRVDKISFSMPGPAAAMSGGERLLYVISGPFRMISLLVTAIASFLFFLPKLFVGIFLFYVLWFLRSGITLCFSYLTSLFRKSVGKKFIYKERRNKNKT